MNQSYRLLGTVAISHRPSSAKMRFLRRPIAPGKAGDGSADITVLSGVNESTMVKRPRGWGGRPATGKYDQSLAQNQWKRWTCEEEWWHTPVPISRLPSGMNS